MNKHVNCFFFFHVFATYHFMLTVSPPPHTPSVLLQALNDDIGHQHHSHDDHEHMGHDQHHHNTPDDDDNNSHSQRGSHSHDHVHGPDCPVDCADGGSDERRSQASLLSSSKATTRGRRGEETFGISSFTFRARRPFHPERLLAFVMEYLPSVLRSKVRGDREEES